MAENAPVTERPGDLYKISVPASDRGKYLLEITFPSSRLARPDSINTLKVSVWRPGQTISVDGIRVVNKGEGEDRMFFCLATDDFKHKVTQGMTSIDFVQRGTAAGCRQLIDPTQTFHDTNGKGWAVCPHCGLRWETKFLTTDIFYRNTYAKLAQSIEFIYRGACGGNADLLIWYNAKDPRICALAPHDERARIKLARKPAIYPWGRLLRDSMTCNDLSKLIKNFLLA